MKNWPEYEYRSLMTREIDGERVILPLWYNITKEDIKGYSLYLADIKALFINNENFTKMLPPILRVVRPDIWKELRMRTVLKNAIARSVPKESKLSAIKEATSKQSKLTNQQLIRSKAIFYGIGRHLNYSFDEYIDNYEMDLVPERELQTWEIMNACYLEMIERHQEVTDKEKEYYYREILALSLGIQNVPDVKLSDNEIKELVNLWKENYYEF